jgi:hypothetical protein
MSSNGGHLGRTTTPHLGRTTTPPWQATEPNLIQSSPPNLRFLPHPRVLRRIGLTYPIPCSPESPTLQIHNRQSCNGKTSRQGYGYAPVPSVEPLNLPFFPDAGELNIFIQDLSLFHNY